MKISYKWLNEYLPQGPEVKMPETPHKMGEILTAVGLEVEGIELFEEVQGNLEGLVIGEVLSCEKHPDADKLQIAKVDIGADELVDIVCGAPNIATGQKVIVATPGTTLYPTGGEAFVIRKATIRGVQSMGMICSENEAGLGTSHEGIMVLPAESMTGSSASEYFQLYTDHTIEIGLTPNRMDAMSHLGVAKDVCAYLSHHQRKEVKVKAPYKNAFAPDSKTAEFNVEIEDPSNCPRYAGVSISGIEVKESPRWLKNKLKSIGLKPLNNIVDITNFILHETGQPLHAFDADKIKGKRIIVKTLSENTAFTTLEGKQRKLTAEDIMICDGEGTPMCMAGIYGGAESGVTNNTVNLFLESAVFDPIAIRKSLVYHDLRTDAAMRFEKGVNINNTINVLKRAALLIREVAGGKITSDIIDNYPAPREATQIALSNHYLKKISGKNYHPDTVKNILKSLNFSIVREGLDDLLVEVPFSNPDISLPADIIEEIMRIDGLDNIAIPETIHMAPAADPNVKGTLIKEKIITWLNGNGFSEIFTNSITNSDYFDAKTLDDAVKILNGLSEELDVLRPSMLPTGLECLAYNMNRKNHNLLFLEFGKTYTAANNRYEEKEHLALYFTGSRNPVNWNHPEKNVDIFYVKGICSALMQLAGLPEFHWEITEEPELEESLVLKNGGISVGKIGKVGKESCHKFSIKQAVYFACIDWEKLLELTAEKGTVFKIIPKYPQVHRDLSVVLDKEITYRQVEEEVLSLRIKKLVDMQLFDLFESEKLGVNKKSFAISFTFSDSEKTLTDKETDKMMTAIIDKLEKSLNAIIRRNA